MRGVPLVDSVLKNAMKSTEKLNLIDRPGVVILLDRLAFLLAFCSPNKK